MGSLLFILSFLPYAAAQPADTVGVRSDTTLLRVVEPFPIDTAEVLPADTLGVRTTGVNAADTVVQVLRGRAYRDSIPWRQRHSPGRATLLSALVPGAGQIYNRKYWKAPIVWAGLGVSYMFIHENTQEYQRYRTAYLALVDGDPNTMDEFEGQFTPAEVRRVMETYQRWRDLSYIAIAGVYILNIIDASVDAHFVRFDVSPDLSLGIGPSLPVAAMGGVGLSLQIAVR